MYTQRRSVPRIPSAASDPRRIPKFGMCTPWIWFLASVNVMVPDQPKDRPHEVAGESTARRTDRASERLCEIAQRTFSRPCKGVPNVVSDASPKAFVGKDHTRALFRVDKTVKRNVSFDFEQSFTSRCSPHPSSIVLYLRIPVMQREDQW